MIEDPKEFLLIPSEIEHEKNLKTLIGSFKNKSHNKFVVLAFTVVRPICFERISDYG